MTAALQITPNDKTQMSNRTGAALLMEREAA